MKHALINGGTGVLAPVTRHLLEAGHTVALIALWMMFVSLTAGAESRTLRVGLIAPMSGDFANFGRGSAQAMELANASQTGNALTLLIEDNRTCQAPEAVSAFHKLVDIDKADLVVTFCTAAAQAVLSLAQAKGVPLIQLTEPGLDPNGYMIKMMPDSKPFADFLARALRRKYTRIALLANSTEVNTGPRGNVPLFKEAFEKLGGKIVLVLEFPDSETDFRTAILKLRSSGADAVVPFLWPVQQMASFLNQADQLGLWSSMKLGGSFVFEFVYPQLIEVYPQLSKLNGLESVNFLSETSPLFQRQYRERFGEEPPQFADYAYDAAVMIKRCGVDGACLRAKTEGVSGPIEFGDDGRRLGRFINKKLENGVFVAEDSGGSAPIDSRR